MQWHQPFFELLISLQMIFGCERAIRKAEGQLFATRRYKTGL
jgi:hypothetical protein